jgi:hypothetical protein
LTRRPKRRPPSGQPFPRTQYSFYLLIVTESCGDRVRNIFELHFLLKHPVLLSIGASATQIDFTECLAPSTLVASCCYTNLLFASCFFRPISGAASIRCSPPGLYASLTPTFFGKTEEWLFWSGKNSPGSLLMRPPEEDCREDQSLTSKQFTMPPNLRPRSNVPQPASRSASKKKASGPREVCCQLVLIDHNLTCMNIQSTQAPRAPKAQESTHKPNKSASTRKPLSSNTEQARKQTLPSQETIEDNPFPTQADVQDTFHAASSLEPRRGRGNQKRRAKGNTFPPRPEARPPVRESPATLNHVSSFVLLLLVMLD